MTHAFPRNCALILVDVQQGFDSPHWGARNLPEAESNIASLLEAFRQAGRLVIHVRHMSTDPSSPLRPGQPGNEFKPEALPRGGEPVVLKTVNSSFIGTGLEALLRERDIRTVVLAGFTANHCVSTTARMAGNLGFDAWVVSDATVAFSLRAVDGEAIPAEVMHRVGLAELRGEFAGVLTSSEAIRAVSN